jgi:hypothetical protein
MASPAIATHNKPSPVFPAFLMVHILLEATWKNEQSRTIPARNKPLKGLVGRSI